ncbi:hypothetical protein Actkin_02136 [Actinokineospora sp. UTMC 2448]|nr:hypothetical protein Actkin_02136 [Actinokineospora sp. UTMC 2448]
MTTNPQPHAWTGDPPPGPPQTLSGVIGHALSSWGMTTRLVVVLVVCSALVVGGLWLLDATLTAGPVQITPRR